MNFDNERYEYLLHTWGGFYNQPYRKIHQKNEGYYFFDTRNELDKYVEELRDIEKHLSANYLAIAISEGKDVRYRTIAKMEFIVKGIPYYYEEDFGFAYSIEAARYMFEDGNYACDCNRSIFIRGKYGAVINEFECGDTIQLGYLEIDQVKDNSSYPHFILAE